MTNVGHAGSDEDLINLFALHIRQEFGIIWIVGAAEDRLLRALQKRERWNTRKMMQEVYCYRRRMF